MKYLKLIPVFIALFFVSICTVNAQDADAGSKMTKEQKAQIAKDAKAFRDKLNLTEAQKPTFNEITKRYGEQLKAMKDFDGGKLAKYKKLKSIMSAKNAEMKKVLTGDQYEMYLEHQEENKEKIKEAKNNKG